jgi:hypothetical protein
MESDHIRQDAIEVSVRDLHIENSIEGTLLRVLTKSLIEVIPVREPHSKNLTEKRAVNSKVVLMEPHTENLIKIGEAILLEKNECANNHNSQEKFPIDSQSILLIKICVIITWGFGDN